VRPVAVIGNLASDVVDGAAPRVGGGPFHAARALELLGRPARVVTKLAEADRDLLLPPLLELGVPVEWQPSASTARFAFSYDGDTRLMTMEALGEPWSPAEAAGWVGDALDGVRWVQVAPLARGEFEAATLEVLARRHALLLDGQGLVRGAHPGPLVLAGEPDPELLRHVTVLKLAEEEALALVGGLERSRLAALGVPEVVVTFGSRGCLLLADGELTAVPARVVDVEPTGAGDAFGAGYVAARNAGESPLAAAHRAAELVSDLLDRRLP
jgi:sugar/nucleoside kinase (ribokinase family)